MCIHSDAASQADRRSAHNALERQRRENLNTKFQELAHALPSLQTVRRPSKTMIVAKSLEFVSSSLSRESNYKNEITDLRKKNEKLRKQASCLPSTQTKRRSRPSTPLQTNSPTSSLPSPPLQQHYSQEEQQYQSKQKRSSAMVAAHRLDHSTYQDDHHEKKMIQKRYQQQQLQLQQQQQFYQFQQEQREKYTITQESQQQIMRDPFFSTTEVDYESWMASTAPAVMPERDYCFYDNDPSLMASSTMYQRDPLLTTVPPPSYYYQPTTMNPVMMFASTAPGVTMPPPPSMEVYHSPVSGVPTNSPLS
ncbi:hypothetical protein INT45_003217 [Circinella minor]|uniref:BHLH domain-containing protein n=1 Tax=Circinella minor TaxID=1195481 RepID=A0A8H7S918_9FUNG|nr:hypothetical protein INT45_003217 [Circinella minor]